MDNDKERFQTEAMRHLDELYASALRMTRNRERAEDLVSEVFTRAWKSFAQYQPGTNIRAWLYRILTNTYINHYRHDQREPMMVELDKPQDTEDGSGGSLYDHLADLKAGPGENPERVLSNRFLDRDLTEAIDRLPDEFRMVLLLSDVQNFSYQDIADMLEIPIGTVRSRLWRGRRLLQQALWRQAVEAGVISTKEKPPV